MQKALTAVLIPALLAGCAMFRKGQDTASRPVENPRTEAIGAPPAFALPGIPLKNDGPDAARPAAHPEKKAVTPPAAEEDKQTKADPPPAAPAAAAQPAEPAAVPAAPASGGKDLEFHLSAARKYSARKKYLSAAAEYRAALGYIPAGDPRAVHALEREGAMTLRAGDTAKAAEYFEAAIKKASDLGVTGNDLSNAHLGLGYCLERSKDVSGAIANYEKALKYTSSKAVKARLNETLQSLKKSGS
ncbi:MAG: hypothetical protein M0011_05005 [Elusimicrobia bacterium]|nr:hypothetical protein [Elusimicrobiota bacterium]